MRGAVLCRWLRVFTIAAAALGPLCPCPGGAQKQEGKVVAFRWLPPVSGQQTVKVFADTEIRVAVEADIEGNIPAVIFEIPEKFKNFGIAIERPFSAVKDGKARSTVLFRIIGGMPLGRHDLVVHILEQSSRAEIGTGKIPFIILPSDIECLC